VNIAIPNCVSAHSQSFIKIVKSRRMWSIESKRYG